MTDPAATTFEVRSLVAMRSVGGVLPADVISAAVAGADLPGLGAADYHLELGVTPKEAANRAWAVLRGAWAAYRDALAARPEGDPATGLTRERWLSVLLRELGFGRVPPTAAGGLVADGRSWPVSHLVGGHLPVHLLGWGVDLDKRTPGMAGAAERAPSAMVQDLLNRSDEHLWALVANGATLRVLRDSSTLVGPSFVEFDLGAIFDGDLFSDFVALFLVCHQSRFEPTDPALGPSSCWLERWRNHAVEQGARALGALRVGVRDAVATIGTGLVAHPANAALRDQLDARTLDPEDFRHALLRLVYRILFCFVAEDRDLLLDPGAPPHVRERYERWFSTSRLRRIAIRRAGDGHGDHWEALRLVLDSLSREEGCPALGLVGLGGIFETGHADLDPSLRLDNRTLLRALRSLCITRPLPGGPQRVVDYRHLGAEELGGIYEGLLEFVPHYDSIARTFELVPAAGNDRKKTGAYYTPSSLTETLLDSALDPLLDRAMSQADPESALLGLTVCDPACGSGHFLVAAGRRIAAQVASVRAEGAEPTVEQLHAAMHDVVSRCLFGVDVNPLAAELAKVSLWLEGMQAGRALSLLDGHIKVGNALLGATPALLSGGIPDEAFSPIEGDDKKACSSLRRRNKAERSGQGRFGHTDGISVGSSQVFHAAAAFETLAPLTLAEVHEAARRLRAFDASPELRRMRLVADAWCAAFVAPKAPGNAEITQATFEAIHDGSAAPDVLEAVEELRVRYQWFHWHLEYPQIFTTGTVNDVHPVTGWRGGFDCVIGNPPWERVKLQEQEWFASRLPAVADAPNAAARKKLIAELAEERPELHRNFLADRRRAEGESHFLRSSGRYPLTGRGDINTYAVFAEADRSLLAPTGRLGVILPTGIATDATTQYFFKDLVTSKALVALYDFENALPLFEGVHRSFKFCLLTLSGVKDPVDAAWFAFFAHHPDDLQREGVRFRLTPTEITLLNPNTGTCPVFRTRRDAEITLGIYRRHPVLVRHGDPEGNPWGLSFMTMFHMSNDSGLFRTRTELEADGWTLVGNAFQREGEKMLSLHEGKMGQQFDHRFGSFFGVGDNDISLNADHSPTATVQPRYWIGTDVTEDRLRRRTWGTECALLGHRRVARSTDERTAIASMLPWGPASYGWIITSGPNAMSLVALLACFNSYVYDYCLRNALSQPSIPQGTSEQLPVPAPAVFAAACPWDPTASLESWMAARSMELVYTALDMAPLAHDLGDDGSPFAWDAERRAALRAELDGAFLHVYGVGRDDAQYILSTFPIANRKDPSLAERVLDAYDRIAQAMDTGAPFASTLDPLPGCGPRHQELP